MSDREMSVEAIRAAWMEPLPEAERNARDDIAFLLAALPAPAGATSPSERRAVGPMWNAVRRAALIMAQDGDLHAFDAALEAAAVPPGGTGEREPHPLDVLAVARQAARRHHYALAVHGSLARDVDLVAVPWKEDASEPSVLIEAIRKAVSGIIMVADDSPEVGRDGYYVINDASKHSPVQRAHGRRVWSIYGVLGGGYIDLSVMPPRLRAPQEENPE